MTDTLSPVYVVESWERYSEFALSDGSIVMVKVVPRGIHRVEGQFDPNGNPVYRWADNTIFSQVKESPMIIRAECHEDDPQAQ